MHLKSVALALTVVGSFALPIDPSNREVLVLLNVLLKMQVLTNVQNLSPLVRNLEKRQYVNENGYWWPPRRDPRVPTIPTTAQGLNAASFFGAGLLRPY